MCSPTLITASCGSDLMADISSLRLSISPSCRSSRYLPFHKFNISTTVDMMFLDMLATSGSIDISWRIADGFGGMLVIVVGNARSSSGMSMIFIFRDCQYARDDKVYSTNLEAPIHSRWRWHPLIGQLYPQSTQFLLVIISKVRFVQTSPTKETQLKEVFDIK